MFTTGVPELDAILKGGYPERSTILILGSSESGKEMLAYRFVSGGRVQGDSCLYITGLSSNEVLQDMKAHSIELEPSSISWISGGEGERRFHPDNLSGLSFDIKDYVAHEGERRTRVAFDSLSSLLAINSSDSVYRFLAQLLPELRRHRICFLAVLEEGMHDSKTLASMEQLFDGVLELRPSIEGDNGVTVRLKKMRGSDVQVDSPVRVLRPDEPSTVMKKTDHFQPRIAVLPFVNMSPDVNDEYFADGMTEELIDRLGRLRQLKVIARTSVMSYKGEKKKASQIARELEVGTLVEGSVRKAGSKVRVTVQLISADSEEHIWSSHYDRELDDVFEVQSEIAEKVAGKLKVQMVESEKRTLEKKPTENMEAYSFFLRGRELFREMTDSSLKEGLDLYQRAASLDANFARAHVGIAECHLYLGNLGYESWDVMLPLTRASLERALEIDPDIPEAHAARSMLLFNMDDAPAAKAEASKALKINPSLPDPHLRLCELAFLEGDPEEGVRQIAAAYGLDPIRKDLIWLAGEAYFWTGREQEAIEHWRKTEQLAPAYRDMAEYYLSKGDLRQARKYHARFVKLHPASPWVTCMGGIIDAYAGEREKALRAINGLKEAKMGPVEFNYIGFVYNALGDFDSFFQCMNRAVEAHTFNAFVVMYSPLFARARTDPRYQAIVEKIRKPER